MITFVHIEDGYPEKGVTIPTVAVESLDVVTDPFELGSSKRVANRVWDIDIYALNKTQRDEFSYLIMDALEGEIPVYDYDGGFPPTVLTRLGCLEVGTIRTEIIRILPELVDKYYYRATVSFTAVYNQF